MKLKGLNKFREKTPLFQGKKIVLIPFFFLSVLTLILLFQFVFYFLIAVIPLTGILIYLKPWFPVIGLIITALFGLFLVYLMWARRDTLKRKYGALSYQKVILFGFSGVIVMFSVVEQAIFPFYLGISAFSTDPYNLFAMSWISIIPVIGIYLDFIFFILGIFICIIALLMVYRAINTFGFDYMAVVYLYFPEESEIQNNEIYSVLRHPTYSALIILCLGGIFLHQNFYSLLNFGIFLVVMFIHVHFVEEKELITRFGDSYKDFRKNVPAFFVHPKNWKTFFKFVIGKI